jgi:glutathionylspermidine synthase
MRFDFHWTPDGWRISEANTDVAGGYIESSGMTRLFAAEYPEYAMAGDPAKVLVEAARRLMQSGGVVGFMHLTIYSEDRQIMLFLEKCMKAAGLATCLFSPDQLRWAQGQASVISAWYQGPLGFLFRFVPAEWLSAQSTRTGWPSLFGDGDTPVCNPAYAVLTQTKRFPLVWDRLRSPLLTWRALLPPTAPCAPGELDRDGWILKAALSHEGHNIGMPGVTASDEWVRIRKEAGRAPDLWVRQKRFETLPLATPDGPMYPCLGVYVIDGKTAGAFGRLAQRPLTDDRSRDVVVLVERLD